MSRNDMWHPEQPSSHTVAIFFLVMRSPRVQCPSCMGGPALDASLCTSSSFVFLPHHGQIRQELSTFQHFGDRASFLEERARGAHLHALAATGAGFRGSPRLVQIRNHLGIDAPSHNVPGMRALNLVADAQATRAQDAAVVVDDEALV